MHFDVGRNATYRSHFRPTSALTSIFSKLSDLSSTHPYVHVIALGFSKAFDTLHATFMEKIAALPITLLPCTVSPELYMNRRLM